MLVDKINYPKYSKWPQTFPQWPIHFAQCTFISRLCPLHDAIICQQAYCKYNHTLYGSNGSKQGAPKVRVPIFWRSDRGSTQASNRLPKQCRTQKRGGLQYKRVGILLLICTNMRKELKDCRMKSQIQSKHSKTFHKTGLNPLHHYYKSATLKLCYFSVSYSFSFHRKYSKFTDLSIHKQKENNTFF